MYSCGQVGWCLSLLRSFEKAVILHERRAPKATSATSGVTFADRVRSRGLTALLLAANPSRPDGIFQSRYRKSGFSFLPENVQEQWHQVR